ncbi:hypothetical protein RB594_004062 [Gaeumannomyces avenae]
MGWLTITTLAAILGVSEATLRFGCSTVSVQRLDPLVEPGNIPSAHVHQIVGGDAFNATMDPNMDISQTSTCMTCEFLENRSNYWTAVLYFRARNGSYHRVPQYPNACHDPQVGGMTVYYTQESFFSNGRKKITAFKPREQGFRMVVGDPGTTTRQAAMNHSGLRYVCLQNVMTRFPETPDFPTRPCPGGIMAVHHFPACWDGKNLDSPDHQSHMFNTAGEAFAVARPCPASHPVRMPQLALETMWDTTPFNGRVAVARGRRPAVCVVARRPARLRHPRRLRLRLAGRRAAARYGLALHFPGLRRRRRAPNHPAARGQERVKRQEHRGGAD